MMKNTDSKWLSLQNRMIPEIVGPNTVNNKCVDGNMF